MPGLFIIGKLDLYVTWQVTKMWWNMWDFSRVIWLIYSLFGNLFDHLTISISFISYFLVSLRSGAESMTLGNHPILRKSSELFDLIVTHLWDRKKLELFIATNKRKHRLPLSMLVSDSDARGTRGAEVWTSGLFSVRIYSLLDISPWLRPQFLPSVLLISKWDQDRLQRAYTHSGIVT